MLRSVVVVWTLACSAALFSHYENIITALGFIGAWLGGLMMLADVRDVLRREHIQPGVVLLDDAAAPSLVDIGRGRQTKQRRQTMADTQVDPLSEIQERLVRLQRFAADADCKHACGELSNYAVAHAVALVALAEEALLSAGRIAEMERMVCTPSTKGPVSKTGADRQTDDMQLGRRSSALDLVHVRHQGLRLQPAFDTVGAMAEKWVTGEEANLEAEAWLREQDVKIAEAEREASGLKGKDLKHAKRRIADLKRARTLGPRGLRATLRTRTESQQEVKSPLPDVGGSRA